MTQRLARLAVPLAGLLVLLPWVSSSASIVLGIALALIVGNPWPIHSRALAQRALTLSVVGLGAGMNLSVVGRVGVHGFAYTALGIGTAFVVGTLLGRRLGVGRDTSLLITVGTAICGGSAIAAVAPVIRAKEHDVSLALVSVFVLNAGALILFPPVGRALHLGQDSFGLWCALAIHDTSSVVGAAAQYGDRALEVATAAKLARALWIVPVTFAVATFRARVPQAEDGPVGKPKRPWFILGFLTVAALTTFVPSLHAAALLVSAGAHRLLVFTLFLIGLGLSRTALRTLGLRPFLQAVALWTTLAAGSLAGVLSGWVR